MISAPSLFAVLIFLHCIADYSLQSEFLALQKCRSYTSRIIPWWHAMGVHAIIHGGFVGLATQSLCLGIAETMVHFVIDDCKCRRLFGINTDQALHVECKALWVLVWWGMR